MRGDLRGKVVPPCHLLNVHPEEVAVKGGTLKVLREGIGEVVLPVHLLAREVSGAETVLHPQVCNVQVPHAPEALSATYADGRLGVGLEQQRPG